MPEPTTRLPNAYSLTMGDSCFSVWCAAAGGCRRNALRIGLTRTGVLRALSESAVVDGDATATIGGDHG